MNAAGHDGETFEIATQIELENAVGLGQSGFTNPVGNGWIILCHLWAKNLAQPNRSSVAAGVELVMEPVFYFGIRLAGKP